MAGNFTTVTLTIDCRAREARQLRAALDSMRAKQEGVTLGQLIAAITAVGLHADNPARSGDDAIKALLDAIPPSAWDHWLSAEFLFRAQGVPHAVARASADPTGPDA
jgi:hypothetical protein